MTGTIEKYAGIMALTVSLIYYGGCQNKMDYSKLPPYQNPNLPVDERVDDLIARMTLEEKVSQMVNDAPAIERLDVPAYNWWNECLHGVGRAGKATVFPQAIGLAAMWDKEQMFKVATAISDEARAKHHEFLRRNKRGIYQGLTFWSPNINIFRDPRWGRGMETYGEDPFLTGKMAVQFIRGLQGDDTKYLKLVATAKHYAVHSGPEPARHTFDAYTDVRDLRETYLPHFKMAIEDGGAYSVMCAYNRYMGKACCGSDPLLNGILRNEWGFNGYVVSDCGAIRDIHERHKVVNTREEAVALAVQAGCDLNCGHQYPALVRAVEQGLISEADIDISLKRLFKARFKLGMFDPPDMVPYAKISYRVVDSYKHRKLALETARKSIVLLKNENNTLPLNKDAGTIAVIGPNADDVDVLLGNYNGIPKQPVTPLQGIRDKVGSKSTVTYAPGCEWVEGLPVLSVVPASALKTADGKPGLQAAYFDNREFKGTPKLERVDSNIDFNWWDRAPVRQFDDDNFAVRWTGLLVPPVSGQYALGGEGFNAFRIFLNDTLLVAYPDPHHSKKVYKWVELDANKEYPVTIEFMESSGDASMQLLWQVPDPDREKHALEVAQAADVVILVMGLSPQLEGEEMPIELKGFSGGDRVDIVLPEIQQQLIRNIQALGKPTVLLLMNGSAVAINWAQEHIPAIVEAWYPGQAAGTAIADVLFGDYNPAGRLPVTFYKSIKQVPPFTDYRMVGRTYRYFEGESLYPFGYGLSYTTFRYNDLKFPTQINAGDSIHISVSVTNSGTMDGEEVVQLYVSDEQASAPVPIRSLKGFTRIFLKAGETQTVTFTLIPHDLSMINRRHQRVVEPGFFTISVGGGQPDTDAPTVSGRVEVIGKEFMFNSL